MIKKYKIILCVAFVSLSLCAIQDVENSSFDESQVKNESKKMRKDLLWSREHCIKCVVESLKLFPQNRKNVHETLECMCTQNEDIFWEAGLMLAEMKRLQDNDRLKEADQLSQDLATCMDDLDMPNYKEAQYRLRQARKDAEVEKKTS